MGGRMKVEKECLFETMPSFKLPRTAPVCCHQVVEGQFDDAPEPSLQNDQIGHSQKTDPTDPKNVLSNPSTGGIFGLPATETYPGFAQQVWPPASPGVLTGPTQPSNVAAARRETMEKAQFMAAQSPKPQQLQALKTITLGFAPIAPRPPNASTQTRPYHVPDRMRPIPPHSTAKTTSKRSPLLTTTNENIKRPKLATNDVSPAILPASPTRITYHPHPVLLPGNNTQERLPAHSPVASDCQAKQYPIATEHLTDRDILLGRGGRANYHPGNAVFRDIVASYRVAYCTAAKGNKMQLARNLNNYFRVRGSRFVTEIGGYWYEVGDERVNKKTSQALREGTSCVVRETLEKNLDFHQSAASQKRQGTSGGSETQCATSLINLGRKRQFSEVFREGPSA